VTVDTEADSEWTVAARPTYENIRALPAFQELCDRYGVRPTYLVTYDVAAHNSSLAVLQALAQDGNCEIGAHMHGWRTPPFYSSPDNDKPCYPYLYEYPREVQVEKFETLTDYLEQVFQIKMTSHRAGRWGIDAYGMSLLEARGYRVDSSVTPFRSWKHQKGDPDGEGGPSFLRAPARPYYPAVDDIQKPGTRNILEVPVSIRVLDLWLKTDLSKMLAGLFSGDQFAKRKMRNILRKLRIAEVVSLNPALNSSGHMIALCRKLLRQWQPAVNMAFHSTELIPGGSPQVRTANDADRVWQGLDAVFACIKASAPVRSRTLTEYAEQFSVGTRAPIQHEGISREEERDSSS